MRILDIVEGSSKSENIGREYATLTFFACGIEVQSFCEVIHDGDNTSRLQLLKAVI